MGVATTPPKAPMLQKTKTKTKTALLDKGYLEAVFVWRFETFQEHISNHGNGSCAFGQ